MSDWKLHDINVSRRYIHEKEIEELIARYALQLGTTETFSHTHTHNTSHNTHDTSSSIPDILFNCEESVFQSNHDEAMNQLQQLFQVLSPALTVINCSKSNVSGRLFYRAREVQVADPEKEIVSLEGRVNSDVSSNTQYVIRDDNPPLHYEEDIEEEYASKPEGSSLRFNHLNTHSAHQASGKRMYKYVNTRYDSSTERFYRCYVELDWLCKVRVAMLNNTDLSGHGLSSLVTATATNLQILRINQCIKLDNAGLYSIVKNCKSLVEFECAENPNLTPHGLFFLSEFAVPQIRQLHLLRLNQTHIADEFFVAFFHALEEKHFTGFLHYGASSRPEIIIQGHAQQLAENFGPSRIPDTSNRNQSVSADLAMLSAAPSVSAHSNRNSPQNMVFPSDLLYHFQRNPDTLIDLTHKDITKKVLRQLTTEQKEYLIRRKTQLIQSLPAEQQQTYYQKVFRQTDELSTNSNRYYYSLDLSNQYVNDSLLKLMLDRLGKHLFEVKLNNTFITQAGLHALSNCTNLRVLSLSGCHNITNKYEANMIMIQNIKNMTELMELNISESRLSGRMLTLHPFLKLFALYADSCPLSSHAIRLLAETCSVSLSVLSLSNCSFINSRSISYLLQFRNLVELDLSNCVSLTDAEVMYLSMYESDHLQHMSRIIVTGISGMTDARCQLLANKLTQKKFEYTSYASNTEPIVVIGSSNDGDPKPVRFCGEHTQQDHNYSTINSNSNNRTALIAAARKHLHDHRAQSTFVPASNQSHDNAGGSFSHFHSFDTSAQPNSRQEPASYMMLRRNDILYSANQTERNTISDDQSQPQNTNDLNVNKGLSQNPLQHSISTPDSMSVHPGHPIRASTVPVNQRRRTNERMFDITESSNYSSLEQKDIAAPSYESEPMSRYTPSFNSTAHSSYESSQSNDSHHSTPGFSAHNSVSSTSAHSPYPQWASPGQPGQLALTAADSNHTSHLTQRPHLSYHSNPIPGSGSHSVQPLHRFSTESIQANNAHYELPPLGKYSSLHESNFQPYSDSKTYSSQSSVSRHLASPAVVRLPPSTTTTEHSTFFDSSNYMSLATSDLHTNAHAIDQIQQGLSRVSLTNHVRANSQLPMLSVYRQSSLIADAAVEPAIGAVVEVPDTAQNLSRQSALQSSLIHAAAKPQSYAEDLDLPS